jgi:hypothetical protein
MRTGLRTIRIRKRIGVMVDARFNTSRFVPICRARLGHRWLVLELQGTECILYSPGCQAAVHFIVPEA